MATFPGNAKDEADSPAKNSFAITKHDTNEVGTVIPRFLYVGSAGTIVMRLAGDDADTTFTGVTAGSVLPVRPLFIRSTSTTAGGFVGLF